MINQLKQFVPSSVCLKCDGCCRFQLADSSWRPKTGEEEGIKETDDKGYVLTVPANDHQSCTFFNKADNSCGIYLKRPFECALYPFIVSQSPQGPKVYMHLACPYIQDNEVDPKLEEYLAYLKDFFSQPKTRSFLKDNSRLLHDYSEFEAELKFLFSIEV